MRRSRLLLDMVDLQRGAPVPLHRQLYESLRLQILDGRLPARTRLPASRQLADDLAVSRNTVIAAYDALQAEGYLDAITGSGTRVAALPASPAQSRATKRARVGSGSREIRKACSCTPVTRLRPEGKVSHGSRSM